MRNKHEIIDLVDLQSIERKESQQSKIFVLSLMAGIFVGLGAVFSVMVGSSTPDLISVKILSGIAFCLGLILIVITGAELFTGNNLMLISFMNKKITLKDLVKNWIIVYLGNLLGSLFLVFLIFNSQTYLINDALLGERIISLAESKVSLGFGVAFFKGILCNFLVCLAVWMTLAAKNISGKILAILFPITAFCVLGFEHSVANMFLIPMGVALKHFAVPDFWVIADILKSELTNLTIS